VSFQRRLSVCLFSHDISKSDADWITKLALQMFHDESWISFYFGVQSNSARGCIAIAVLSLFGGKPTMRNALMRSYVDVPSKVPIPVGYLDNHIVQ